MAEQPKLPFFDSIVKIPIRDMEKDIKADISMEDYQGQTTERLNQPPQRGNQPETLTFKRSSTTVENVCRLWI